MDMDSSSTRSARCFLSVFSVLALLFSASVFAADQQQVALDRSLKPSDEVSSEPPTIFTDMGVVQRKEMRKTGKLLLSPYGTVNFTDGPYAYYRANFDVGYAFNEFWEVYVGIAPVINRKRSVTNYIEGQTLADGSTLNFDAAKGKLQYTLTAFWAPLYGKDSLGLTKIVHSDTFLKFGADIVQYETESGIGFFLGVGKTFFLGKQTGIRFSVTENYVQTVFNGKKDFGFVTGIDGGLVFYLF
ncbi:MAG: hypothetical protein ACJ763_17675 [Bdellovibrionia bacterium]